MAAMELTRELTDNLAGPHLELSKDEEDFSAGEDLLDVLRDALRRRGFAVLRLDNTAERAALDAAAAAGTALLSAAADAEGGSSGSSSRVPRRHPSYPKLALHGMGRCSTPAYGGREQFHSICGAADLCPWPSAEFREAFQGGEAVLRALCLSSLQLLGADALEEWRSSVAADGDPSVCDAFLYPAPPDPEEASAPKDPKIAMDSHLDPGWWTAKQGSDAHGLQLWDRELGAWVDAESPAFYGDGCEPRDAVVIFAGERAAQWTEGTAFEVPAVPHRIMAPLGPHPRGSFVYELRDHCC